MPKTVKRRKNKLAGRYRNRWPDEAEISGRMIPKWVADSCRNRWPDHPEICTFLTFEDLRDAVKKQSQNERSLRYVFGVVDWINHPSRIQIIRWLRKNDIPWSPCAGLSNSGIITGGYQGQIYLDVPYDVNKPEDQQHPLFKKCLSFLEDNAGQVKWEGVKFYGLTLNKAITIGQASQSSL